MTDRLIQYKAHGDLPGQWRVRILATTGTSAIHDIADAAPPEGGR